MNNNFSTTIKKLPINMLGTDYVIGDLHGCFNLLERLLTEVEFDKDNDRLFSVGDLADRGSDSLRCLELLAEPWFYAVQGNHEVLLVDFFKAYLDNGKLANLDDVNNTGFTKYGGDWITGYFLPERECMTDEFNRALNKVLQLPLMWVVGEGDSRFHVVHAELVKPDFKTSEQWVWLDSDIDKWLAEGAVPLELHERLLWGRLLMYESRLYGSQGFERNQPSLSTTFCGHTPQPAPCQNLSHVCVDTGAFLTLSARNLDGDYGLTLFNAHQSCWFTASYQHEGIARGRLPKP